eukprot:CAMPEP_0172623098 /NCGR_PEP_ID=MMETSP1068-20121228/125776_1 /TAXON_ID=35684 /ORGANISM="Pseudopedinella elastica, Strain CCMP716" /LENGTH=314 /DNA_ID=CAMNT_0013431521 /DNA_START=7 /DNA_END=951 /DNA_ORIENTATION=+
MTFEGRNLYGHVYNHNEVFAASKKKKWRPKHHELAFGKASSRPHWYRNVKYGMPSELPPPIASKRFDAQVSEPPADAPGSWASGQIRAHNEQLLHHSTGESQLYMSHSSNLVLEGHGGGEKGIVNERANANAMAEFGKEQLRHNTYTRFANEAIHDGDEGLALVRRETSNSTIQPLYPMSVINDSFNRHLVAKAISDQAKPVRALDRSGADRHPTQVMYLPYSRTRDDFPTSDGRKLEGLAKEMGPAWWPGREGREGGASKLGHGGGGGGGGGGQRHSKVIAPNGFEPRSSTPPGFMHDAQTGQPIHRPQAPYW